MKTNLNKLFIFFLFFSLVPCLFAAGKKDKEFRVAAKKGMAAAPFAYLCENNPKLGKDIQFTFSAYNDYDQVLSDLLQGTAMVGVLPVEVAAKVYLQDSGSIVALGVCGNGSLYVVSKNRAISSLSQLKGRTVAAFNPDTSVEYMFRHLLKKNDIAVDGTENGVKIDFSIAPANITSALISGSVEYALMTEPYVSVAEIKDSEIARNIDLQQEYAAFADGEPFPAFLLVANKKYLQENRDTVKAFVSAYKIATDWTVGKPLRAGVLLQKHDFGMIAPVASHAVPYASLTWTDAKPARHDIEAVLNVYMPFTSDNPEKKLPDELFYYVF